MHRHNWLTIFTIAGLILGALTGEFIHARAQAVRGGETALARHDQLYQAREQPGAQLTQAELRELNELRRQVGPLRVKRTFDKLADYIGADIFMGLLKMLIMPLILSSVICGVTSAGDFSRMSRMAGKTFLYFFSTMIMAVVLGMTIVSIVQPGRGFFEGPSGEAERLSYLELGQQRQAEIAQKQQASGVEAPTGTIDALLGILTRMIPRNPFADLASGQTLPVIVFALFFGIVLSMMGPRGRPLVELARSLMDVMLKMTEYVIYLAPLGVFFLVGKAIAAIGLEHFVAKIGIYMMTVIGALLIHGLIVLPLILLVFARTNPLRFFMAMREAVLLAFSTASSSATLPVTIDCAQTRAGCSRKAAGFVLPLGSTINMDGTALYEAVAVIFLAQAFSVEPLAMGDMVILALTATLAAVGAAGIPEAGLTTMIVVIAAVNAGGTVFIPPAAIGLILGVDRILDMTRTMVNAWGDAIGAKIITVHEPGDMDGPEPGPVAEVRQ